MRSVRWPVGCWILTMLLLAAACGSHESAGPAPRVQRGIRFVSGDNVTDSVGAELPLPLIIEVRDSSGALAPLATVVRFEPVVDPVHGPEALVGALALPGFTAFASGATDASGRTGALVRLSTVPRQVRIVVRVPTLGLQDTALFRAVAGGVALIELAPRDTTIRSGRSYPIVATVRDRHGNALPSVPTWSAAGTAIGGTVSSSGVALATATGRYTVVATAAGVTDTVRFSAVPEATILAHDRSRGEIVTIGLDGSNRRVQTRVTDGGIGVRPRWVPGRSTVIYSGYAEPFQSVFLLDSAGTPRPFVNSRPPGISHMADVAPVADGSWVYLAAYDSNCATLEYCLHRVRMDGTAMELLPAVRGRPEQTVRPSPSPDGRRVALNTLIAGIARLRVLDVVTGAFLPLDVPGAFPQWAPTGEMIAFLEGDGSLSVVNAGGPTPRRIVDGTGYLAGRAFTWSPDGAWILYNGEQGLTLVHVLERTVVPLPGMGNLVEPSWR